MLAHPFEEFGAEYLGQSQAIEQILVGSGLPARPGQPAARNHKMNMGMKGKTPGVRMQYSHQPQLVPQTLIVAGKLEERLPGDLKQGVAGPSKMVPGKAPQLGRQGEGYQ